MKTLFTPPSSSVDLFRLRISLFALRLGVFIVMFFWSIDKLLQPEHAAQVFEHFYLIGNLGGMALAVIGVVQLVVVFGFVAGLFKTWTYGLVLAMHAVSTFSSWKQYLAPMENLLFFAAWPMLAACLALFLLRSQDTLWSADAALATRCE